MDSDWISPTDEEAEALERECLDAALSAIGQLPDEPEVTHIARLSLAAFVAAEQVERRADRATQARAAELGKHAHSHYVDKAHVVATAFMVATGNLTKGDAHPYARGSMWALGFAKACMAMRFMSEVESAVEDGDFWDSDAGKVLSATTREGA
jgi:hypothetical protein